MSTKTQLKELSVLIGKRRDELHKKLDIDIKKDEQTRKEQKDESNR